MSKERQLQATVTTDDIQRLASLSYLSPSPEQIVKLQKDIGNILHCVEQIQRVNTDGVPPLISVLEKNNLKQREDKPTKEYKEDETPLMGIAPDRDGSFYVVPKQKTGGPIYDE